MLEILIQVVLLVVGFAMLIKGADFFVDGASGIADRLGIPQLIIGLTIVAMGTSAPETAISISAAMKGSADIAVGNVLGSNILNILLVLGITALIVPIGVQKSTVKFEIPFVIIISVLFAVIGLWDNKIGRIDGIILWLLFIAYLAYLFIVAKKDSCATLEKQELANEKPKQSIIKMLVLIVLGLVLIVWGSNITVDAATAIAKMFGMSERLIGLTIVAFGTSLPELVTSITAAIKKKADIAVGNIVGSNIFNILFVIGTSALITPVVYQQQFWIDSVICIAASALLLLCVINRKNELKRWGGAVMLAGYVGYFIYLLSA